jgi:hypothetical protein
MSATVRASGRSVRAHLPSPCAPRQQRPGRIIGPLTLSDQNQSSRSGPRRGSGGAWSGRLCRSGANAGQADLVVALTIRSGLQCFGGHPRLGSQGIQSGMIFRRVITRIELARERYRKPVLPSGSPTSSRPRSGIETSRRCAPPRRPRLAPPMGTPAATRRGKLRSFRRAACRPPTDPS